MAEERRGFSERWTGGDSEWIRHLIVDPFSSRSTLKLMMSLKVGQGNQKYPLKEKGKERCPGALYASKTLSI